VAPGDEQESDIGLHGIGPDDGQPMFPNGVVDFGGGEILLRGEIDHVGGVAFAGDGVDELPFVCGVVPDDYRFEEACDRATVRFSELFEAGKDTLVVYSFMFPRYSGDSRPGPAEGETARLPLSETPCASCTSFLDSLDGAALHLTQRLNLAVVAKSGPDRIRAFAHERGWRHLRLLSSRENTYNRDYHAETPEGEQIPILNVFVRTGDHVRHTWASELMYAPRDEGTEARHIDSLWPIWNVLDLTPDGRGTESSFPGLRYG
jgi:predicted dithiol-disulfide oxidoreductase (DUF899 family)